MPNKERWSDFAKVGIVKKKQKQHGKWDEEYVRFSCPYGCGTLVEIPVTNAINQKATKCRAHLMTCTAINASGESAQDDHRVADARKALKATGNPTAVERLVKRTRIEAALDAVPTPAQDTNELVLVKTTLDEERAKRARLELSETNLIASNDRLNARVHGLESQMESTKSELASIRSELAARDAWQMQILAKLGITAPPIPDIKVISKMMLNGPEVQELKEVDRFLKLVTPGDHRERMEKLRLMAQLKANRSKFSGITMDDKMGLHTGGSGCTSGSKLIIQEMREKLRNAVRLIHPDKYSIQNNTEATALINTLLVKLRD